MDFYGTEICFKTLLKVLIFAEISDPRQKFLLNCLSRSKSIWRQNANFHGVPCSLVEVSGRQNWANVDNLAHFAQNATKKTTNVEKWCFLTFLKMDDFLKFCGVVGPKFFKNRSSSKMSKNIIFQHLLFFVAFWAKCAKLPTFA